METYDLLKEDLVQLAIRHHTRAEAEILAGRIADLITNVAYTLMYDHKHDYLHEERPF